MTNLEARWFDEGTAADVAAAINMNRTRIKWRSAHWVNTQWKIAQDAGRLPPFSRPFNGFTKGPREIMLRFRDVMMDSKRHLNTANKGVLECA